MTTSQERSRAEHPEDNLGEFAEELRLLAEAVLERVEPVLRRTAADGRGNWASCSWCPVCAAAAVVRGEHHDVVAAIADHGTAIVTVLREALAGVPVEPVIPPDLDPDSAEYHAWLHDSYGHRSAPERPFGMTDPVDEQRAADPTAPGDAAPTGGDAADESKDSAPTSDSARAGTHTSAVAGLGGLLAKFAAGAQAVAADRRARGHESSAANWHGSAGAEGNATSSGKSRGAASGAAGQPGGTVRGKASEDAVGQTGSAAGEPAGHAGATTGRGTRGATSGGPAASEASKTQSQAGTDAGSEDSLGRGPGTARRPDGQAGRGGDQVRGGDQSAGRSGAQQTGRGGRGARSGYVPIDVTIKA